MSKLAVRACGTNWTRGELPGVVGDVECVEEEEPFLSIVDERPEYGSADRGLSGGGRAVG
jgi:hypothetical protein